MGRFAFLREYPPARGAGRTEKMLRRARHYLEKNPQGRAVILTQHGRTRWMRDRAESTLHEHRGRWTVLPFENLRESGRGVDPKRTAVFVDHYTTHQIVKRSLSPHLLDSEVWTGCE